MRGTHQAYQAKLDELRQFIRATDHVEALADAVAGKGIVDRKGLGLDERCTELGESVAARRRLAYSAVVVGLYGAFESFAEDLVMAFLRELDILCPHFSDLPQAVRDRHIEVSAQLLLNRGIDKYKDRCDVDDVVHRLSRSAAGLGARRLNELAFTDHRSNFRAESLNEFFRAAGVPDFVQRIKGHPPFHDYLTNVEGVEAIERLSNAVVLKDLDDLAQRRNEVAHGAPATILANESMLSRVSFIEQLGAAMFAVTDAELVRYLAIHACDPLPSPIAVYGKSVVCFPLEAVSLRVGSRIVTRSPTGEIRHGEVVRIELDGSPLPEVSAPPPVQVGLELNFVVKKTYDFFLVRQSPS